jgi:hypothetical protein
MNETALASTTIAQRKGAGIGLDEEVFKVVSAEISSPIVSGGGIKKSASVVGGEPPWDFVSALGCHEDARAVLVLFTIGKFEESSPHHNSSIGNLIRV